MCSGPCGQHYPITHFWSDAGAADGRMSRCPTCEKNARRASAEARANGQLEGAVETRNGRVVHFSEEERRRRSERAKELHAQGRFGGRAIGARGGQAVNRHRITDAVVDHFRQPGEKQLIIDTIRKALKGKNKHLGSRVAFDLLRMEERVAERERAERGGAVNPSDMPDDELVALVEQGITAMIERGEIPVDLVLGEDQVQDVA
jgi:hypothetical protein